MSSKESRHPTCFRGCRFRDWYVAVAEFPCFKSSKKQESETIYLPWKCEISEIDVRNTKAERVNAALYVSIVANDSKDMVLKNGQQKDNHVTSKNSVNITKK